VQAICGDPTQVSDTVEIVLKPVYDPQGRVAGHLPVGVPKQVWTYHFGLSRLMYLLTFLEGALVKIDTGGYGHQGDGAKTSPARMLGRFSPSAVSAMACQYLAASRNCRAEAARMRW
jgi:Protein of unknown function (DUF2845)